MIMKKPKIYSFIKTPCGRAKYAELAKHKGFLPNIRLGLFVFIATLRDWNLANPNED